MDSRGWFLLSIRRYGRLQSRSEMPPVAQRMCNDDNYEHEEIKGLEVEVLQMHLLQEEEFHR